MSKIFVQNQKVENNIPSPLVASSSSSKLLLSRSSMQEEDKKPDKTSSPMNNLCEKMIVNGQEEISSMAGPVSFFFLKFFYFCLIFNFNCFLPV